MNRTLQILFEYLEVLNLKNKRAAKKIMWEAEDAINDAAKSKKKGKDNKDEHEGDA